MIKKLLFTTLSLLLVTSLYPTQSSTAQSGASILSLSPARTEIQINPGGTTTFDTVLKNSSNAAVTATVRFADFEPLPSGEPNLLASDASNATYGLRSWMSGPSTINIAAGSQAVYKTTVKAPANAKKQTFYGTAIFGYGAANGSDISRSVGTIVLANVGTPTIATADIVDLAIKASSTDVLTDASATIHLTIKNNGDYMFVPTARLTITDDQDNIIATLSPASSGNILPNSERVFVFEWKGTLEKDKTYTVRPVVTLPGGTAVTTSTTQKLYGPEEPASTETPAAPTEEKKESKSMLLPVVAGIGTLLLLAVLAAIILHSRKKNTASVSTAFAQPATTAFVPPAPTAFMPPAEPVVGTPPSQIFPPDPPSTPQQ